MATNRVKMFAGNGPVNLEKAINEWFVGEGKSAQVQAMNTAIAESSNPDGKSGQKIIVTIWYSE